MEIVRGRRDPDAVRRLLDALPDWFGLPASNAGYVEAAGRLPALLAVDPDGTVVGVLLLDRHFPAAAEMHLLAVDPDRHRRGIGRALVAAAERDLAADGVAYLQVKTLGPSHPSEPYARTRAFYTACGYVPIEELHDVWPGDNPMLIMVKALHP